MQFFRTIFGISLKALKASAQRHQDEMMEDSQVTRLIILPLKIQSLRIRLSSGPVAWEASQFWL